MIKKITAFLIILLILPIESVFASGSASVSYNASMDAYQVFFESGTVQRVVLKTYDSTYTTVQKVDEISTEDYYEFVTVSCNGYYEVFGYDSAGNQTAYAKFHATETSCNGESTGGSDGGQSSGGGQTCDSCALLSCPGWSDYMGKLDDIKAAIPPAPDWNKVADTFRDSIVPRLISDLGGMLGRAPDLPAIPEQPSPLDDGDLKKPTGQDSGVKGFDANDIKDGKKIEFKDDESGGWNIMNPLDSMPEQETFLPADNNEVAPSPEEPENPTPKEPSEPENPAPTPEEPDNPTPTPKEPDNITPTPKEPENLTPSDPKEPENPAPTPKEPDNPTPTPGESGGGAPIPSEPSYSFPMPGGSGGTAPIPSPDGNKAPIPGVDSSTVPIPQ